MQIDTKGIELGDEVEDRITGARGIVTGIHQWTTGCARISIQARVGKDGKVPETVGSDVLTVNVLKAGPRHDIDRSKGGPMPEPTRIVEPRR